MVGDANPRKVKKERKNALSALKVAMAVQPNAHLSNVGTLSFLADRMKAMLAEQPFDASVILARRRPDSEPIGFLQGENLRGLRRRKRTRLRISGRHIQRQGGQFPKNGHSGYL